MKKVLIIILCCTALINYAQNDPWVYVMDEAGAASNPKKLLKTKDNCLVSVCVRNNNSVFVYKVSMQGQLVWKTTIQDTAHKYSIYDMAELPDNSLALVGYRKNTEVTEFYPYFLQINSNGDIINEIVFADHNWSYIKFIDYFFGEIQLQLMPVSNYDTYVQYHYALDLDSEEILPRTLGLINISVDLGNNKRVFYKYPDSFLITNQEYDTILYKSYNLSSIQKLYYDSSRELIYGIGVDSDSANYYGGVFVLNKDLEYLRFFPFDTLCPQKDGGSINDILINQAGNLVLAGSIIFMGEEHASVYINDINTGHPVGGHIFYESMAQFSFQVKELDYGYALLQYSMNVEQSRKYIVRVSADGDLNSVPENRFISTTDFQVFPNPASSYICLQFKKSKQGHLIIYNMQGIKVSEVNLELSQQHLIDISHLSEENYMLEFIENSNTRYCKQLLILK